jgi:NAD(P)-dependent dehydrogenase (short-subunit alcohol dehydrogenase family)
MDSPSCRESNSTPRACRQTSYSAALTAALEKAGVRVLALGPETIRAVTNMTVTAAEIGETITSAKRILES